MDRKKAKITYIISTAIYAVLFLFGLGVTYYSQFVDTDRLTLAGQTIYWMVMMAGHPEIFIQFYTTMPEIVGHKHP